ncbi:MAG: DUF378 domain-containing protein [Candidatus Krumholzibacteriota bacterium]|nr:DUF378 domain-containing protein [Candidatus Krumholzibacteriota bacterium]
MNKLNTLDWIALILVIIGGLNWFLVGISGFNLVAAIFGDTAADISIMSKIIYILVGLSAIYTIFILGKLQKK